MPSKEIKIVTHGGGFHTDDVFAVASLLMLHNGKDVRVVRSRDKSELLDADYVVDYGYVYDPEKNLFDHHQEGGAGERENGIPYASFGLVWRHFGEEIAGDEEVARIIDERLAQPIDAFDNGVNLVDHKREDVGPYIIQAVINSLEPVWGESNLSKDDAFNRDAVTLAKKVIEREIVHAKSLLEAQKVVTKKYEEAKDKKLIVFDEGHGWKRMLITHLLSKYEKPIYFVRPHEDGNWQVVCVMDDIKVFKNRKDLPASWSGKIDKNLQEASGVGDAVFCHRKRFMCIADSKEGAIKMAKKGLKA